MNGNKEILKPKGVKKKMNIIEQILWLQNIDGIGISMMNKFYLGYLQQNKTDDELEEIILTKHKRVTHVMLDEAKQKAKSIYNAIESDPSVHVITIFDRNYPRQFMALGHKKPLLLFAKGNVNLLNTPSVGVVGTREPSKRSAQVEKVLVQQIVGWTGATVVSGLAVGCDYIAHRTTLDVGGNTVAVLPSGFNQIVPRENIPLANEILANGGCLISEYSPDTSAERYTFVRRDALTAALSDKLLVIECMKASGTMHTVDAAVEMEKTIGVLQLEEVYIGNAPDMESYSGNLALIDDKVGQAIMNPPQMAKFLGISTN